MDKAHEEIEHSAPFAGLLNAARTAPDLAALLVMASIGIGIAAYLTTVHYAGVEPVCTVGGAINCAKVTSSQYSVVPGTQLPITVPGALWFIVSGVLAWIALDRTVRGIAEPARLRVAHVLWGMVGMVFVLYLVWAELVALHSICEWCTVIHILTLLTFLIALNRLTRPVEPVLYEPHQSSRAGYTTGNNALMPRSHAADGRGASGLPSTRSRPQISGGMPRHARRGRSR